VAFWNGTTAKKNAALKYRNRYQFQHSKGLDSFGLQKIPVWHGWLLDL
jgi:hypothetical protein